jgi:carbonic anhydrase
MDGTRQSPINIDGPFNENQESNRELVFWYTDEPKSEVVDVQRDTESGKIFVSGSWGGLTYNGIDYHHYGMFIHHPSEHSFGKEKLRADLEVQMAHKSTDGDILMISLNFDIWPVPKPSFKKAKNGGLVQEPIRMVENQFLNALSF